jgi:ribosomal protein S27AE
VIGAITTWRTDEPCPACGSGLVLLDDGSPAIRWECRACGDTSPPADPDEMYGGDW